MRHAMIMAGGVGTRLWPLSRAARPKQVLPVLPGGQSLLGLALDRIKPLVPEDRCWICTNESFGTIIQNDLEFPSEQLLLEPEGRDTLNAIGFAAAIINTKDPDATLTVLTADHIIEPTERMLAGLNDGNACVEQHPETVITYTVQPTMPSEAYGYIEEGDEIATGVSHAVQYVEKPDTATAQACLDAGTFGWSAGMFTFKCATMLDLIRRFEPECHAGLMQIAEAWNTPNRDRVLREIYPTLKKISIDYAIMQPISRDASVSMGVIRLDVAWIDIGSWPTFASIAQAVDDDGNRAVGASSHVALQDCKDTLVVGASDSHHVAAIGCDNLIIVHTPDATLVCTKDAAEQMKTLIEQLPDTLR